MGLLLRNNAGKGGGWGLVEYDAVPRDHVRRKHHKHMGRATGEGNTYSTTSPDADAAAEHQQSAPVPEHEHSSVHAEQGSCHQHAAPEAVKTHENGGDVAAMLLPQTKRSACRNGQVKYGKVSNQDQVDRLM